LTRGEGDSRANLFDWTYKAIVLDGVAAAAEHAFVAAD
jgi:hypothetical protein